MKNNKFKKATEKWRLLVAADIVVFSFIENKLNVVLIKRKFEPGAGQWAIPGGFVRENESLEQAALRELGEETGLSGHNYLERFCVGDEIVQSGDEILMFLCDYCGSVSLLHGGRHSAR